MGQQFVLESNASHSGGEPRHPAAQEIALLTATAAELDDMRALVCKFPEQDPSDVLMHISGLVGRLAEIRVALLRSNTPRAASLRTKEVEPLRDDLDLQFKIHSRRIALMEWELKLSGGGA